MRHINLRCLRIFRPKREEVVGGCGRLHNEEFHNLYDSPNKIRVIKSRKITLAKHVARMGERGNAYKILVEKPEGKRPPARPRCRWEGNIRVDLKYICW
jgi:hypothetical protein